MRVELWLLRKGKWGVLLQATGQPHVYLQRDRDPRRNNALYFSGLCIQASPQDRAGKCRDKKVMTIAGRI